MTDPLAKYVRGDGTTHWYDTEAMAHDLRRMWPVVEAAKVLADASDAIDKLDTYDDAVEAMEYERVLSAYYDEAITGVINAIREVRALDAAEGTA